MRTNMADDDTMTVTTAADAAEHRRSIRSFDAKPIPEGDLRELLRLAGRAPSAFNAQPWRFVVVQDPAT
jgi:nitroreductase